VGSAHSLVRAAFKGKYSIKSNSINNLIDCFTHKNNSNGYLWVAILFNLQSGGKYVWLRVWWNLRITCFSVRCMGYSKNFPKWRRHGEKSALDRTRSSFPYYRLPALVFSWNQKVTYLRVGRNSFLVHPSRKARLSGPFLLFETPLPIPLCQRCKDLAKREGQLHVLRFVSDSHWMAAKFNGRGCISA